MASQVMPKPRPGPGLERTHPGVTHLSCKLSYKQPTCCKRTLFPMQPALKTPQTCEAFFPFQSMFSVLANP